MKQIKDVIYNMPLEADGKFVSIDRLRLPVNDTQNEPDYPKEAVNSQPSHTKGYSLITLINDSGVITPVTSLNITSNRITIDKSTLIVDVININRTDTAQIVGGMIKGKTYPNIIRSHKRKTVGMGMKKRAVYNIRYKVPVNED